MGLHRRGAATAFVLVLIAQAMLLGACNNGEELPREAGLWFAFPDSVLGQEGPIRVVHVDSGEEKSVGETGVYRNVAWSPQGHLVAAIRVGAESELVLFNLEDEEAETLTYPIGIDEAQVSWSPDGARLVVLSAAGIVMFSRDLELVAEIGPPQEAIAPADYSPGVWSTDSAFFAAYFHGYVAVVDRLGQIQPINPAEFVRYPGDTRWLTITGWESPDAIAVFEEAERRSPTRYVVDIRGEEPEVLSSSDFEEGARPFDGLMTEASEAAGGTEVLLGGNASPPDLRWVVAKPGPGDAPVRVLVRRGEIFLAVATGLFGRADPAELARDLSVMYLSPETVAR